MSDIFKIKPNCFLEAGYLAVLSYFDKRVDPVTGEAGVSHNGVDCVRDRDGSNFATITAIADGTVSLCHFGEKSNTSYSNPRGNYVIIDHGEFSTLYQHLENRQYVLEGAKVVKGAPIGYMGNTGKSTGGHLHIEVHRGGKPIDPLPYLLGEAVIPTPSPRYYLALTHPLSEGDSGEAVGLLQEAIARISPEFEAEMLSHSHTNGKFDCSFGPSMTKTVKHLQTTAGIEPTGIFDAPTHNLLTQSSTELISKINKAIEILKG